MNQQSFTLENSTRFTEQELAKLPKSLIKMKTQISALTEKTVQQKRELAGTCAELKVLETMMEKYITSQLNKELKGKQKKPSGFASPMQISPDMCDFLSVNHGTKISRTSATLFINEYIRKNNLQCENNKRTFLPDAALSKLLRIDNPQPLSYFDLQKYLNCHFSKNGVSDEIVNDTSTTTFSANA